jgi:hypothetical protein
MLEVDMLSVFWVKAHFVERHLGKRLFLLWSVVVNWYLHFSRVSRVSILPGNGTKSGLIKHEVGKLCEARNGNYGSVNNCIIVAIACVQKLLHLF